MTFVAAGAMRQWLGVLLRPFSRRLDVRIVALFLGLLLLVQLATFATIRHSIDNNARTQIASELKTGENVLRHLLAQNAQNLTGAARLLAADYGFRSAVASGDRATLTDALDNQAARIGASVALFTDASLEPVASTLENPSAIVAQVRADVGGSATLDTTVRVVDGRPFQLVTVPVKAPVLIGHVTMGFPLQAQLLRDMEELSALRMGLVSRRHHGRWQALPLGGEQVPMVDVAAQLHESAMLPVIVIAGEHSSARLVSLGADARDEVAAVLLRSVDEAVARYHDLQITLLAITLLGLAVFAIGSVLTARRITGPIKSLSREAERLGSGDYATPVAVRSNDEVRELARSFESMREGIQQREAQITRLAYWDSLTGLPNRAGFGNELARRVATAHEAGEDCAVLMLDLDRFKHVNDVLGHAFGDRLLKQIAVRLSEGVLRDDDVVARLGGDKFAVCLPGADADTALTLAHRLQQALARPLQLDDHTVDVGAGVGVATFPSHGREAHTLMGRAEVAMYAAKARGSAVTLYDAGLDSASEESLSLLTELRAAIRQDQLQLFLQPKIALDTGRVRGAEALVRWQHPQRGMVPPMRFIPFAERTGFIGAITAWMIERCAQRSRELRDLGLDLRMSVNLSARDLLDHDLPMKLDRRLQRDGVDPARLCMEITESAIMEDPQRALQTLQGLHALGVRLSIDDFGTGYSSLAYLKRLPLHELKIDKSFVMAMERDRADLKIVRSTIDLAHNLGLSVVAEGVENAQSWALLRAMRCDEAQGFYIARPLPEAHFAAWVDAWSAPQTRLDSGLAALV